MIHQKTSNGLNDLVQRENKLSLFQQHVLVMLLDSVVYNLSIVVIGDEVLAIMVDADDRTALLDDLKNFPLFLGGIGVHHQMTGIIASKNELLLFKSDALQTVSSFCVE